MHVDLGGFAFRSPFTAIVLVIADELFLFRIDGDHRIALRQKRFRFFVDMTELKVAIWLVEALFLFVV